MKGSLSFISWTLISADRFPSCDFPNILQEERGVKPTVRLGCFPAQCRPVRRALSAVSLSLAGMLQGYPSLAIRNRHRCRYSPPFTFCFSTRRLRLGRASETLRHPVREMQCLIQINREPLVDPVWYTERLLEVTPSTIFPETQTATLSSISSFRAYN